MTTKKRFNNIRILTDDSDPIYFHSGEDFVRYKMPAGTRVIYCNPPMKGIKDRKAAIRYALNHPEGDCPPLYAQLKPGMKVTIAIDDISVPLPPMKTPDIRQEMLEIVLEMLENHGVDDYHMVIALALHRRMTEDEIERMVGKEIFKKHYPNTLYNLDSEDKDGMVILGKTECDETVQIFKRAAESDLLIYINVNYVTMNGGYKSIGTGLSGYASIQHHHNPETIVKSDSYMDPKKSALYDSNTRMGRMINEKINVFHIETAFNNQMYEPALEVLSKPEDDWTPSDRIKFFAMQKALAKLPRAAKRKYMYKIPAPYELTGVFAGRTEEVHEKTLEKCFQQHAVPVKGQADILCYGIPFASPYSVNSIMNPLLVQVMALGYFFNMYRGVPLIKKGGSLIITHPMVEEFDPVQHPSYIEFFNRCLSQTNNTHKLQYKWEKEFAENPNYIQMYRKQNAYHGVHPFYMWYWGENGRQHVGEVIVVGAENEHVPKRLGWKSAKTMDDAIEMARQSQGRDASITVMHHPPFILADVEP